MVTARGDCALGELRCDQTVRNAIGLPPLLRDEGYDCTDVTLWPVHVSLADRLRNAASGLLGRRYLLLRAAPPSPSDIEKEICRIRSDDLTAMGTESGGRVLLFGASRTHNGISLTRVTIQSLALDADAAEVRRVKEREMESDGWKARYRSANVLLGIEGADLSPIWIDREVRGRLGLEQLSPVLVRRDSRSAFSRETQDFGVALLASLLALEGILDPLLIEAGVRAVGRGAIVLSAAIMLALSLIVWRLRSDIR